MIAACENSCLLRRIPKPPLGRYINCLWYGATYSAAHAMERVLPTGSVDLVIRLDQDRIRIFDDRGECRLAVKNAVISGAFCRPRVIERKQQSSVVGVHFRPGGAALFFSQPFGELTNLAVAAEDVWGADINELREQLLEVESPPAMFDVLELALMRRLADASTQQRIIQRALNDFVASPTLSRVRQVCDATGYRPKRFIELFEDYVGLTPKVLCRVLRFQTVLDRIVAQPQINWSRVALDCGYCDQSHLIRDFREFSGICPSQYRPVELDRRNHVAIEAASRR